MLSKLSKKMTSSAVKKLMKGEVQRMEGKKHPHTGLVSLLLKGGSKK